MKCVQCIWSKINQFTGNLGTNTIDYVSNKELYVILTTLEKNPDSMCVHDFLISLCVWEPCLSALYVRTLPPCVRTQPPVYEWSPYLPLCERTYLLICENPPSMCENPASMYENPTSVRTLSLYENPASCVWVIPLSPCVWEPCMSIEQYEVFSLSLCDLQSTCTPGWIFTLTNVRT